MRHLIAFLFRILFKSKSLKHTYFGFYKKIFYPFNIFKGVRKRVIYRNKIILILDIDDWIQQNLYFLNEYEEKEIKFVESYLTKGDIFIDIGANIGLFSLVASNQVGGAGVVYAFEPINNNYNKLTNHIRINDMNNIIAEKLAVSDNQNILKFYINEHEKDSGMATNYSDKYTSTENVSSTSLDLYFTNKELGRVRLIKIDIEGGEYSALIGMQEILKTHKPVLLIEINPDTPHGQKSIESFLSDLGYAKYFLDNNGFLINNRLPEDQSNNYLFCYTL